MILIFLLAAGLIIYVAYNRYSSGSQAMHRTCGECGNALEDGWEYCPYCGCRQDREGRA